MTTSDEISNEASSEDLANKQVSTSNELETQATLKQDPIMDRKKTNAGAYIALAIVITIVFLMLASGTNWNSSCVTPLFLVYLALIGAAISSYTKEKESYERKATEENAISEFRKKYRAIKDQLDIPETAKQIIFYKSSMKSPIKLTNKKNDVYVWIFEDNICFFPYTPASIDSVSLDDMKITTIPVRQIEYFSTQGEVYRENRISGGGGGGSSLGGAVAGGLIAGETGAIIGSRKKVNEIKSELITHDTRETFLNYFDNGRHSLFFDIGAYQVFNDLMPEKEFSIVSAVRTSEIIKSQTSINDQKSVADQIRELAKLKDEGLLTEEEFSVKKKQLLDKIA